MSVVVCGIDPSMTRTAICLGSDPVNFTMRTFESKNMGKLVHDRMRRLVGVAGAIDAFLKEHSPDVILVESYSHGSTNRISEMAEWGGILRWHACDHVAYGNLREVAPLTLKKFITGKGKGEKQMMIAHVASHYGQIFETNDEVDAFSLYQMGLAAAGVVECRNSAQRQSVEKVIGDRPLTSPLNRQSRFNSEGASHGEEEDCPGAAAVH